MGWVSLGLLLVAVGTVGVVTARDGWNVANRRVRGSALRLGPYVERWDGLRQAVPDPTPLPIAAAYRAVLTSMPRAVLTSPAVQDYWAFLSYTRWAVLVTYLGFVLPLFTLSYAAGAFGAERETRSLVWVLTRPVPRSLLYLGKFLGTLPWCLLFGLGGFAAVCLAGGELGRRAWGLYAPAAAAGTVAFAALFHLFGAVFRRPVVVGLVYVFFYEVLVALLPGGLKLFSLTFYTRCLMYNSAAAAGYPSTLLDGTVPVSTPTAAACLTAATVGLTVLGLVLFGRSEYRDDT